MNNPTPDQLVALTSALMAGLFGVGGTLLGTWLSNRENSKRLKLEISNTEKRHRRDLQLKYLENLFKIRVEAHLTLHQRFNEVSRILEAFFREGKPQSYQQSIRETRTAWSTAYRSQHIFFRTPLLESLFELDDLLLNVYSPSIEWQHAREILARVVARIEWSMGLTDFEEYTRELWKTEIGGSSPPE